MYQLTYISSARSGICGIDVEAILHSSRANNARDAITGLLVHDGVRFLQALEGERTLVEAAFARIKADQRHRAAVMLSKREVSVRQFGSWAMACEQAQATPGAVSMPQIVDALVATVPDPNIRSLFSGFARIDRKKAA
jgi:hypothetical protein